MKSQWNDIVARETVEAYSAKGVSQDVALRVDTHRLLGRDPLLVLHGAATRQSRRVRPTISARITR